MPKHRTSILSYFFVFISFLLGYHEYISQDHNFGTVDSWFPFFKVLLLGLLITLLFEIVFCNLKLCGCCSKDSVS